MSNMLQFSKHPPTQEKLSTQKSPLKSKYNAMLKRKLLLRQSSTIQFKQDRYRYHNLVAVQNVLLLKKLVQSQKPTGQGHPRDFQTRWYLSLQHSRVIRFVILLSSSSTNCAREQEMLSMITPKPKI